MRGLQLLTHGTAVAIGQSKIEQDEIRRCCAQAGTECLFGALGFAHLEACRLEDARTQVAGRFVIVNDKDRYRRLRLGEDRPRIAAEAQERRASRSECSRAALAV